MILLAAQLEVAPFRGGVSEVKRAFLICNPLGVGSLLDCLMRTTVSSSSSSSSSSAGKHGGTGVRGDHAAVPEPSFSERARTLLYLGRIGSLSTLSRKQPGFPFGSVMPYALDACGRPIFLISTMAMHTQNLQADARASLLVTQDDTGGDPLGASRVTLVG